MGVVRHGETDTPLYNRWLSMRRRCKHQDGYENIDVCKRWDSYELFSEDMKEEFEVHVAAQGLRRTSIDRINNSLGYSKSNCKWSNPYEQTINRKCTIYIEIDGKKELLRDVLKSTGVKFNTYRSRLRRGWDNFRAATIK